MNIIWDTIQEDLPKLKAEIYSYSRQIQWGTRHEMAFFPDKANSVTNSGLWK
ncbi:MAG: hypothetical protein NC118_11945 [Eubacterium sp.]|nr:hypothetical protein [Eubacterium sp.]